MVEAVPGNAGRADYPRMLYHPDGRHVVVQSPEQHQAQLAGGFSQFPQPMHQQTPVVKQPMVADSITVLIREILERVLDERGLTKQLGMSLQAAAGIAPKSELPQLELSKRRN